MQQLICKPSTMTMWIRSPQWDGFWILSGLPLGIILLIASRYVPPAVLTVSLLLLLQTGHVMSPIMLAWSHDDFRRVMLRRKTQYIAVPIFILLAGTAVGVATSLMLPHFHPFHGLKILGVDFARDWRNPFVDGLLIYLLWNAYHFGMQNFGVLSIYRHKVGARYGDWQRRIDMAFCLMVQAAVVSLSFLGVLGFSYYGARPFFAALAAAALVVMLLREARATFCAPRIVFIVSHATSLVLVYLSGLWVFAINGANHWLTAIGLSSHVYAGHKERSPLPFAGILIAFGAIMTLLLFVSFPALARHGWTADDIINVTLPVAGFRLFGLGFVHFLYDRWIYKISDPQVRATIGADLFREGKRSSSRSLHKPMDLSRDIARA